MYLRGDVDKLDDQSFHTKIANLPALGWRDWRLLQTVFDAEQEAPVWAHFLSDAEERIALLDYRAATAYAAIACETLMLDIVVAADPNAATRPPSVRNMLTDWETICGPAPWGVWATSDVHKIFDHRNALFHWGRTPEAADAKADVETTREFVRKAEAVHFQRERLSNWPELFRSGHRPA